MTIDSIDDDAIYGDVLSFDQRQALDFLGVEWQGRNVYEIYHDIRDRTVERVTKGYEEAVLNNSPQLPHIKSLLDYVFEKLPENLQDFEDAEEVDIMDVNNHLSKYDPVSGTQSILIAAERKKKKKKKKWWMIAVAVVVVVGAVVVTTALTANPAAGAIAGGAAAGALNNTGPNSDRRKNSDDKKPSAPPPSNPPPPSPTYHTGPTPPRGEQAKSFTLTPAEINAGRPSTFDPMSYAWTPPSSRVSDATPYIHSQEYQSLVHSPLIKQPPTEHTFSQHPRMNPDNRFSNQGPSSSSSTITPFYSASGQIPSSLKSPYTPGVENFSNAFPLISSHRFRPPTGPGALLPTFNPLSNNTLSYQELGQRALAAGNYPQAVQELSRAIETNPTNPSPYLERGVAHFGLGQYDRSLEDYRSYTSQTQKTYPLSVPEFSLGFAKGLPKGIYDSGSGLFLFMSDLVKHPVDTGKQMWESLTLLSQLARSEEWSALSEALAPEVHQLVKEWNTLSSDKRGELAGYAFGKYGADILIPGAVAKAVSTGVKGAQELSMVYRGLKTAEQTLLLESVAELGSGARVGEVFQAHQKTVALGKELGFSTREMVQLKQAGQLEGTVAHAFENIVKNPAMHESFEFFKKAETFLEPYSKQFMPETQVRALIHQTGIQTFPRPSGIPETFRVKITKNGAGILYVHPEHTHTSVRVMPGKLHSQNLSQQKPYVIYKKDGNTLDKFGNAVNSSSPKAHIPIEEFVFKD